MQRHPSSIVALVRNFVVCWWFFAFIIYCYPTGGGTESAAKSIAEKARMSDSLFAMEFIPFLRLHDSLIIPRMAVRQKLFDSLGYRSVVDDQDDAWERIRSTADTVLMNYAVIHRIVKAEIFSMNSDGLVAFYGKLRLGFFCGFATGSIPEHGYHWQIAESGTIITTSVPIYFNTRLVGWFHADYSLGEWLANSMRERVEMAIAGGFLGALGLTLIVALKNKTKRGNNRGK